MNNRHSSQVPSQLDLLGNELSPPAEIHRLFFAIVPDDAVRVAMAHAASHLRAASGLSARWVDPSRYHATLHFLGDYPELRLETVEAAKKAATSLACAPFQWTLDHAAGFHGRQPPCVLRSSEVPEAMQTLWQQLRDALVRGGLGARMERSFVPHVTLAYAHRVTLPPTPVTPVTWPVGDMVLIQSIVGRGPYQVLARWPLRHG